MAYKRGSRYYSRWFDADGRIHRKSHATKREAERSEQLQRALRDLERAARSVRTLLPREQQSEAATIVEAVTAIRRTCASDSAQRNARRVSASARLLLLPSEVRQALGIEKIAMLRFEKIKGGFAVYPERDPIDYYCGILAGCGLSDDIERELDREVE
jgi:hypothetical protein